MTTKVSLSNTLHSSKSSCCPVYPITQREEKYDEEDYKSEDYNEEGYDSEGYDREGYDRDCYDREGYDRDGYDRDGYDRDGYDINGLDRDGFDKEGYNQKGEDKNGFSKTFKTFKQIGRTSLQKILGSESLNINQYLTIQLQDLFISPLIKSKRDEIISNITCIKQNAASSNFILTYVSNSIEKIDKLKKVSKLVGLHSYIYTKDRKSGFYFISTITSTTIYGTSFKTTFAFFGPNGMYYKYKIEKMLNINQTTPGYCRPIATPNIGVSPARAYASSATTTPTSQNWTRIVSQYKKEIEVYLKAWELANKNISPDTVSIQTGFIFQGPTGSGKSTLGIGIAALLGYSLRYIDFDQDIDKQFSSIGAKEVVMMEDIDMSLGTVLNDNKDRAVQRDKTTLSKLRKVMNLIDGKHKYDHVIFIATTNNLGALDPALTRPGRFNKSYEVGTYSKKEIEEMCRSYGVKPEGVIREHGLDLTPAQLKTILEEFLASRKYYLSQKKQEFLMEKYGDKLINPTNEESF